MTFEEILDQAITMLQRRGRVTYRTLKMQFNLDDDHLEALKEEILYSQPQVVDDAGRGLVWPGEPGTTPTPAPSQPEQPATQAAQLRQAEPTTPDAERRQLTVMFCDLVGSTPSPNNSIPRNCGRWCVPISRPALR
ncbi:MAG: hypothetical protein V3W06_03765 [Acidimicrobiia bacterium]